MKGRSLLPIVRRSLHPIRGETLVLGLSGGPDSVALLDVLAALRTELSLGLVAAHLDHRLRSDSSEDGAFCRGLCERLEVPLVVGSAEVRNRAKNDHGGLEEAARIERYAFLGRVKQERGARAILVAHTRDDQAETFLMRLLRGAAGSGLGAMRAVSGDLRRPLLEVSRKAILAHLEERGLSFREDPSNDDPLFVRNRVRHELLPYLEERFNPRIREVIARTASLLADEETLLSVDAEEGIARAGVKEGDSFRLSLDALRVAPPARARRMLRIALAQGGGLRGVGAAHVEKIREISLGATPSGRRLPLPGRREAVFSFGSLLLGPVRSIPASFLLPLPVPGRVVVPGGFSFTAVTDAGAPVSNPWEAVVGMAEGRALVVRSPRPGDRVRLGGRVRRLHRVFMENRVPRDLRAGIPVVASGDEVLFVPGTILDSKIPAGERRVRIAAEAP